MTDSKHTPKPWLTSGRAIYALNDQGENRFTASIEGGWVHRGRFSSERTSHEELLAVRNLIAAAPDLLEALQYVLSAHGEQLTDAFDQAHKAIAKATGAQ